MLQRANRADIVALNRVLVDQFIAALKTNPNLQITVQKRPFDIEPVAMLAIVPSVIVTNPANPANNLKEVVESLQQRGIGLKALSQGIDTTTPGGRLFFHMLAAIAEFEHDLIVERTQ